MKILSVISVSFFAIQVSMASSSFKEPLDLKYSKELTTQVCSVSMPKAIDNTLKSIAKFQPILNDKKNKKIQNFLKSLGRDAKLYPYYISTPGMSGGESFTHKEFASLLMSKLDCNVDEGDRVILNASNILIGNYTPTDIAAQSLRVSDFFQELHGITRKIGQYDSIDRPFPAYYPLFKPLNRYTAFSCFRTTGIDEDGIHSGETFEGVFIGDESDFSEGSELPPVGCLGNTRKIGFLVLIKK